VRAATSGAQEREALARLGAVNQEANIDTAEKDFVPAGRPDHLHASRFRVQPDLLSLVNPAARRRKQ
jgi:hypothetical protein